METNYDSLLERLRAIEKQIEEGGMQPSAKEKVVYVSGEVQKEAAPKPQLTKALSDDVKAVDKNFRAISAQASPMLRMYLKKARLSAGEGNRLQIVLPDVVSAGVVGSDSHKEESKELIAAKTGKEVEIDVKCLEAGRRFEDSFVDIESMIHMDITIED